MFGAIHQHLKQYFNQSFSTHSRREAIKHDILSTIFSRITIHHFHDYR